VPSGARRRTNAPSDRASDQSRRVISSSFNSVDSLVSTLYSYTDVGRNQGGIPVAKRVGYEFAVYVADEHCRWAQENAIWGEGPANAPCASKCKMRKCGNPSKRSSSTAKDWNSFQIFQHHVVTVGDQTRASGARAGLVYRRGDDAEGFSAVSFTRMYQSPLRWSAEYSIFSLRGFDQGPGSLRLVRG